MITWAIIAGMWIHAILNAMVSYRPWRKPWEWVGELKLMWIIVTTIALWLILWLTLHLPPVFGPMRYPSSLWNVPWWEVWR